MSEKKELSLEEMLIELDNCVNNLGDVNISLEASFAEFERGMELVRICNGKIEKVEKDVLALEDNGETVVFDGNDAE